MMGESGSTIRLPSKAHWGIRPRHYVRHPVGQYATNIRVMVDRICFMSRTGIENPALAASPDAAGTEYSSTFELGSKHQLLRQWHTEISAVHFRMIQLKKFV